MAPFSRFFKRSVSKQHSSNEQPKPKSSRKLSGGKPQESQSTLRAQQSRIPGQPLPTPPESSKSASTESIATKKRAFWYRPRYYASPISPSVPLTPVEAYGLEQPQEYEPPRRRTLAKPVKTRPKSMAVSASQQPSAKRPLSMGYVPYSPGSPISQAASASTVSGRPSPNGRQPSHGRFASYSADIPSLLAAGRAPDSTEQTASQSQPRSVSGPSFLSEWTVSSSRPESAIPTPRSSAQFERRPQQSPAISSPAISQANSRRTSIEAPLHQRTASASLVSQRPTEGSGNLAPQHGSHQRSLSLDTTITVEPRPSYEPSSVSREATSYDVSPVISEIDPPPQNTLRNSIGGSDTVAAASHTAPGSSEAREDHPSRHDLMHSVRSNDDNDDVSESSPAVNRSEPTHSVNEAPTQQESAPTDEAKSEEDEVADSTPRQDSHQRQLSSDTIMPERSIEPSPVNPETSGDVSPLESHPGSLRESGDSVDSVTAPDAIISSDSETRAELPLSRNDPTPAIHIDVASDNLAGSAPETAELTSVLPSNDAPTQRPDSSAVQPEFNDGSETEETIPLHGELLKHHPSLDTIAPLRINKPVSVEAVTGGDVSPVESYQDPLRESDAIGSSVTPLHAATSTNTESPAELSPSRHDPIHTSPVNDVGGNPSESAPVNTEPKSTGLSDETSAQHPDPSAHHHGSKDAEELEKINLLQEEPSRRHPSLDTIEPPCSDEPRPVDAEGAGDISPVISEISPIERNQLRGSVDSDADTVAASPTITEPSIISELEEKRPPSRGDPTPATYENNGDSVMSGYAPSGPVRSGHQIVV